MNVKKFLAASSREAYRLVREVLGADAVILSNRNVDGSVEILALASEDVSSLAHTEPAKKTEARSKPAERADQPYRPATFYPSHNDEDAQDEAESQRHAAAGYGADPRFERKVWPKYTPDTEETSEVADEIVQQQGAEATVRPAAFSARFGADAAQSSPAAPAPQPHVENGLLTKFAFDEQNIAGNPDPAAPAVTTQQQGATPAALHPVAAPSEQTSMPQAAAQAVDLGQWNAAPARADAGSVPATSAASAALAARASSLAAGMGNVSPVPMAPVVPAFANQYAGFGVARPVGAPAVAATTALPASAAPAAASPAAGAPRANNGTSNVANNGADEGGSTRLLREGDSGDSLSDALHAARQAMAAREAEARQMTQVVSEIRSMRGMLESQLAEISWSGHQQREPVRAEVMRELLAVGFSASLSRYLAEKMPSGLTQERAMLWAKTILARNLNIATDESEIFDKGGVFALVGPTGVGKTTTTAKLAARCVMKHGTSKLALITTDGYRIGGYEQLRIYGKILGVMVHSVKDDADLRIALEELKHKHTVLIDTVGVSQRDNMVAEQVAMLAGAGTPVKRLLCMSATSNGETLSEVVRAYEGGGLDGCILTKLDEAATTGNVLDVAIRQKLKLYFVANGQRVPEDLYAANGPYLIDRAFRLKRQNASYTLRDEELSLVVGNAVRTASGTEDGQDGESVTDDLKQHEVSLG